jgi:hypothetical protein
MADVRTLKLSLLADVDKFLSGMDRADNATKSFGGNVADYSKKMVKAFALAGAAAAIFGAKIGLDSVKSASDLNEEVSKSEVIFGTAAKDIEAFAKRADTALGLTMTQALKATSTFATFGKASGLTGTDLSKFSKGATILATDLASFYNTNADDAILAIGAALRGESEPIRKYGVLLSDLTIKTKAQEMGLYDGTGALDVQAKSLATYQVILDQTKDAQGDFARTSDGLAGQQKILTAQLETLKTTMGTNLLPVMLKVVEQANFIAKAFGGKDAEGLSERARELAGTYDGQGGGAYNLGLALSNVAQAFSDMFAIITNDEPGSTNALQTFANALNAVAGGIDKIAAAYTAARNLGGRVLDLLIINPGEGPKFADSALGKKLNYKNRAAGGSVMGGQAYKVGEFGPEMFVPSGSGSIRGGGGGGGNTVININGVIDAESARRSIEKLLQNSARRTGPINLVGATL